MQENCSGKKHNQLTSSMTPFRMSLDSTPTLRSSRHSLSNFSGVSLFSMLKRNKSKKHRIYRYCKHAMSHFRPNLTFYFLHLLKIEKCNFPFNCSYFFFPFWDPQTAKYHWKHLSAYKKYFKCFLLLDYQAGSLLKDTSPKLKAHIFLYSSPLLRYALLMKTARKAVILWRTYPLTFLKIASCRSLSFAESSSRLVLREGIHFWAFCPGVFPRNSLHNFEEQSLKQKQVI